MMARAMCHGGDWWRRNVFCPMAILECFVSRRPTEKCMMCFTTPYLMNSMPCKECHLNSSMIADERNLQPLKILAMPIRAARRLTSGLVSLSMESFTRSGRLVMFHKLALRRHFLGRFALRRHFLRNDMIEMIRLYSIACV